MDKAISIVTTVADDRKPAAAKDRAECSKTLTVVAAVVIVVIAIVVAVLTAGVGGSLAAAAITAAAGIVGAAGGSVLGVDAASVIRSQIGAALRMAQSAIANGSTPAGYAARDSVLAKLTRAVDLLQASSLQYAPTRLSLAESPETIDRMNGVLRTLMRLIRPRQFSADIQLVVARLETLSRALADAAARIRERQRFEAQLPGPPRIAGIGTLPR